MLLSLVIKTTEKVSVGSHLNELKKAYKKYDSNKNYYTGVLGGRDGFYVQDDKR